MKRLLTLFTVTFLPLLTIACGANPSSPGSSAGGGNAKVVDPSGNWQIVATDSNGVTLRLSGLFFQTGSTVTAASMIPVGTTSPYNCTGGVNFQNGTVQNTNQFSGTFAISPSVALNFTGTLNDVGTHFDGTYSGLSAGNCAGIGASGAFTGDEVPSISGNWTGTLAPCDWNSSTGVCTTNGTPLQAAFTLTQNDQTGNTTGTYQVTSSTVFTSGTVALASGDFLSGTVWQFTMTDANNNKFMVEAQLGLDRSLSANVFGSSATWKLQMTH